MTKKKVSVTEDQRVAANGSPSLEILGARGNNLKGISCSIPHNSFTVVTGLSGSGKSTLAFDTVYAEGQRRYVETFSPYTRQFLDRVQKPEAESITNVRPALALEQRTRITNSRSTVGSLTDIDDYLRVFWASCSQPICVTCGEELRSFTAKQGAELLGQLIEHSPNATFLLCAQLRAATSTIELSKRGFSRLYNPETGAILDLDDSEISQEQPLATTVVILDRFRGKSFDQQRAADSISLAYQIAGNECLILEGANFSSGAASSNSVATKASRRKAPKSETAPEIITLAAQHGHTVHQIFAEPVCSKGHQRVRPATAALFSYNHPLGACPSCKGFGRILTIDRALCVPDQSKSLQEDALACWSGASAEWERAQLFKFCAKEKIPVNQPWHTLSGAQQDLIFTHNSKGYTGVLPWFEWLEGKAYKMHVRVFLSRYRTGVQCSACSGTRLNETALAYRVAGRTIAEIYSFSIEQLLAWVTHSQKSLPKTLLHNRQIQEVVKTVVARLSTLCDLGLGYLSLDRQARTLSGGETQRVQLTAALGSGLVNTHFVLDEPSVGLHPRDTKRLLSALRNLTDQGNSLLVVEHDPECILAADRVIELGPGAGATGGEIVFSGPAAQWDPSSLTEALKISSGANSHKSDRIEPDQCISICGATARNLKSLSVDIPLNRLVCLTGVSGSGKSTLIHEVLHRAAQLKRGSVQSAPELDWVSGLDRVSAVELIDQTPLAKSPRANIATYSGVWSDIRNELALSESAIARGFTKSHFSFNVDGGRCPLCKGSGFVREDMQFLSDVLIPCELCLGKRFQESVLEVLLRGLSVDELLHSSVQRCAELFADIERIRAPLDILVTLGLGHLRLGHPLSELSGGEAQRLKLVPFVSSSAKHSSLLIFDEPTTGLHPLDIVRLLDLFRLLKRAGHSLLVVEHNLQVIKQADWLIDLGPEAGSQGGEVVMTGNLQRFLKPEAAKASHTARALQLQLAQQQTGKNERTTSLESPKPPENSSTLKIRGAREHNLKNIDLELPLGSMVTITGVSGSGKSTIAKDIIYAEGQRRYLDCLSPYARQFIKGLARPEIDALENIPPTVCVHQHTFQPSRSSTVATMSEVYNYLRLLYAKLGTQFCPDHPDQEISPLTAEELAPQLLKFGTKAVKILAPIIHLKKGEHTEILQRAMAANYSAVRVDGVLGQPSRFLGTLERRKNHSIEFVIGSFVPARVDLELITETLRLGFSAGGGTVVVLTDQEEKIFSVARSCPVCQRGFYRPDPEDFAFTSRRGRCLKCGGSGCNKKGGVCTTCKGTKLGVTGRHVRVNNRPIYELASLTASALLAELQTISVSNSRQQIFEQIVSELRSRLSTLKKMGLDYLPLNRECNTLSTGELQRLRLATALGSPLSGVLYIFDEPTAGLHPADTEGVLRELRTLIDRGNSVLLIEHDRAAMSCSDQIIDIGPGGGSAGGEIVAQGSFQELLAVGASATAAALSIPLAVRTDHPTALGQLTVEHQEINNVKAGSLTLPLGQLVSVIGVSGAGKSTLVHSILGEALTNGTGERSNIVSASPLPPAKKGKATTKKLATEEASTNPKCFTLRSPLATVISDLQVQRVIEVDQSPIGKNSRSTPASFLGVWDSIRKLFAATVEARAAGLGPSFFSFNSGNGRCKACKGRGFITLEMSFLPDAHHSCEECSGSRYTPAALELRYLEHTISEILALTFDEARVLFANHRQIHQPLQQCCELGLGYLTLGQDSSTLSGGESQRLKLAAELSGNRRGHTIYILDEPTTGLHKADVEKLLKVLNRLVAKGHTVIVIEHDEDLVLQSDYLVELGPGPGAAGGAVIFSGTPQQLLNAKSPWGEWLAAAIKTGRAQRPSSALANQIERSTTPKKGAAQPEVKLSARSRTRTAAEIVKH